MNLNPAIQKAALLFVTTSTLISGSLSAEVNPLYTALSEEKKYGRLGEEVAIYGYPLVMMNLARKHATYITTPGENKAPINQFAHTKAQPTPIDPLPFPNIDVFFSNAWLDLSNGPIVLHIPEIEKRYFLFELFDGWTTALATIKSPNDFLVTGPDYKGKIPNGVQVIKSSTNMVYVRGMVQVFGKEDYPILAGLQKNITLTPLANYGKAYSPPTFVPLKESIATKEPPASQVGTMPYTRFFDSLSALLSQNPPALQDVAIVKTMSEIGIEPSRQFNSEDVPFVVQGGLDKAFKSAVDKLKENANSVYARRNGWKTLLRKESDFGTDYLRRALVAQAETPASLSQNLFTLVTDSDNYGNRLNGRKHYKIQIAKEDLPPVDAFWSLTLYNEFECLAYNSTNVYAIQSYADWLEREADGSLVIYIQNEKPQGYGGKYNWLPCPGGNFSLMLRLYQPKATALDGEWIPFSIIDREDP